MSKEQILVLNQVGLGMIREEIYEGEPHYMIASATMPDDIVMNGLLYPAEEIEKYYMGLNKVLSPLGHPVDDSGSFISASSEFSNRHYRVGAQVVNVRRENGRVLHDTAINIATAKETDRGKRLLDRVEAVMNGDMTKPIHTSTGVFLNRTMLETPMSNQYGEYNGIATDYVFDHNAILLDEVGAAGPDQGVGMMVNSKGENVPIFVMNLEQEIVEDTQSLFAQFIKFMKVATNNHKTYNGQVKVNNQSEDLEMTNEELQAALAAHTKEMQANQEALAVQNKSLQDQISELKTNASASEDAIKAELVGKLPFEMEDAKDISVNALQKFVDFLDSKESGTYGERAGNLDVNHSTVDEDFSTDLSKWGKK